jgi:ABC-2 type transport system ATP-binding protein
VLIELSDAASAQLAARALASVTQVRQAGADGRVVRARVSDGPTTLPAVLAGVDAAGVPVRSVSVARPSLDDVYLHHAGRSFSHADGISQERIPVA